MLCIKDDIMAVHAVTMTTGTEGLQRDVVKVLTLTASRLKLDGRSTISEIGQLLCFTDPVTQHSHTVT